MKTQKKYTFTSKIGYGFGDVANGGAFALLSVFYLNFLVTIEGLNPALAGLVVLIARVWDAISDPIMGIISDRVRTRFGRRRVFLLFGSIPLLISFILLWYSFGITDPFGKFLYYTFVYLLFSTAIAITAVPYNALLPDMVEGYKERTGYITIRMLISNLAATIAVTTPALILGPEAMRTPLDFLRMGIVFGFFFSIPLVFSFFMTWENPTQTTNERVGLRGIINEFFSSFRNKTFRQYLGIFVFGQVATDVGTAVTAFWLADVLFRPDFLMIVSGLVMIAAISMLPMNNWLSKKYGKHYPTFILLPLRIIALGIAFFMTPTTPIALLVLACFLMGVGAGAASYVSWVLLPDMPDINELIYGVKNAGVYGAISTFARNFASGVSIFFAGVILNLFGYIESLAGETIVQSDTALFGVRLIFAIVPILLTLITSWLGAKFLLTKQRHHLIRLAINHKHETGMPIQDEQTILACETVAGQPFEQLWAGK